MERSKKCSGELPQRCASSSELSIQVTNRKRKRTVDILSSRRERDRWPASSRRRARPPRAPVVDRRNHQSVLQSALDARARVGTNTLHAAKLRDLVFLEPSHQSLETPLRPLLAVPRVAPKQRLLKAPAQTSRVAPRIPRIGLTSVLVSHDFFTGTRAHTHSLSLSLSQCGRRDHWTHALVCGTLRRRRRCPHRSHRAALRASRRHGHATATITPPRLARTPRPAPTSANLAASLKNSKRIFGDISF